MKTTLHKFIRSESGAVTVDWVVLCAAVVGLAAALTLSIQTGAVNLGDNVSTYITSYEFF